MRILGRHRPTGGLVVEVVGTGAVRVAHETAGPDRVGPLVTPWGRWFLGPYVAACTLWDIVVAHPRGLGRSAAVAALRGVVDVLTDEVTHRGVDAEDAWVDHAGRLVHLRPSPAAGPSCGVPQLARYLARGELAHAVSEDDPQWVRELSALADLSAIRGALSSWEADHDALGAAAFAVGDHALETGDPRVGRVVAIDAAAPSADPPPRAVVARAAVLTLGLGFGAGWWLSRPASGGDDVVHLHVPAADAVTVTCENAVWIARPARMALPTRAETCAVVIDRPQGTLRTTLDMRWPRRYECDVRAGALACDENG